RLMLPCSLLRTSVGFCLNDTIVGYFPSVHLKLSANCPLQWIQMGNETINAWRGSPSGVIILQPHLLINREPPTADGGLTGEICGIDHLTMGKCPIVCTPTAFAMFSLPIISARRT